MSGGWTFIMHGTGTVESPPAEDQPMKDEE